MRNQGGFDSTRHRKQKLKNQSLL